jgi:biopolymer transport protein ExbD
MPLIDILFVVLIFFIVTTTFKIPRHTLTLELPTVNDLPSTEVIEQHSVLAVDKEGHMTLDAVTVPNVGLLDTYLTAFREKNPGRKLELEADQDLTIGKLLGIWDALTRAGIPVKDLPARVRTAEEKSRLPR